MTNAILQSIAIVALTGSFMVASLASASPEPAPHPDPVPYTVDNAEALQGFCQTTCVAWDLDGNCMQWRTECY